MTTVIQLDNVTKHYGTLRAVDQVSLTAEDGEILVLLGASGCGKTTTLRLLAGLEQPDTGSIFLNGGEVAGKKWVPPEDRQIGMVFQDYALFPHLSVQANVAFPLNKLPNAVRKTRIKELLHLVGLEHLGERYPHELSGGQQQRVALARALAPNPAVILLDEPFSNLDAALRKQMREDVHKIIKNAGATAVFVTHDQEEALSIADRIAVMYGGKVLQIGSPREVYLRPTDRTVAAFLGDVNFVPAHADGNTARTILGDLSLTTPASGPVTVILRPEMLTLSPSEADSATGTVDQVRYYGHYQMIYVRLRKDTDRFLRVRKHGIEVFAVGDTVTVHPPESVVVLPELAELERD